MSNGARRNLAAVLVRLDRLDEARAGIAEFHKNAPDYSLKAITRLPFEHKQYQECLIEDLIAVGLPEQ